MADINTNTTDGAIELPQVSTPTDTTNKLFNVGGTLIWNGNDISNTPNLWINGMMDKWQRGIGFSSIAHEAYSADRIQYLKVGTMVSDIQRSTSHPTLAQAGAVLVNSLLLTMTTADVTLGATDFLDLQYTVEGYDASLLYGQEVSLSFWVHSSVTGTYSVAIRNSSGTRSYVMEYTVDSASTWEQKTFTFTLDHVGTWGETTFAGINVDFSLGTGTTYQNASTDTWLAGNYLASDNQVNFAGNVSATYRITDIKMAVSSTTDNIIRPTYNEDLLRCYRYYYETSSIFYLNPRGLTSYSTELRNTFSLPVPMRTTPTYTTGTAAGVTSLVAATTGSDNTQFVISATSNAAVTASMTGFKADAEL